MKLQGNANVPAAGIDMIEQPPSLSLRAADNGAIVEKYGSHGHSTKVCATRHQILDAVNEWIEEAEKFDA